MSGALGSFRVRAGADEADAFRKATGVAAAEGDALPLTFPIRWLVTPEIRAALLAMVPEPDIVLLHEAQAFDYRQPLRVGRDYDLSLDARREALPDRLFVDGTIADLDGTTCATVETVLRLFSTNVVAT